LQIQLLSGPYEFGLELKANGDAKFDAKFEVKFEPGAPFEPKLDESDDRASLDAPP